MDKEQDEVEKQVVVQSKATLIQFLSFFEAAIACKLALHI